MVTSTARMERLSLRRWAAGFIKPDSITGYGLISPALFLMLVLLACPFVLAVYISLTDRILGEPGKFIWFENFLKLFQDKFFSSDGLEFFHLHHSDGLFETGTRADPSPAIESEVSFSGPGSESPFALLDRPHLAQHPHLAKDVLLPVLFFLHGLLRVWPNRRRPQRLRSTCRWRESLGRLGLKEIAAGILDNIDWSLTQMGIGETGGKLRQYFVSRMGPRAIIVMFAKGDIVEGF